MGTSLNWESALATIEESRRADALRQARKLVTMMNEVKASHEAMASAKALLDSARAGFALPQPGTKASQQLLAAALRQVIASPPVQAELAKHQSMLRLLPPLPRLDEPDAKAFDRKQRRIAASHEITVRPWLAKLASEHQNTERVAGIYSSIRRSLWQWPEFAGLGRGARSILEVVIELARDEAFPWYVPVPAEAVRRLARLADGSYTRSVRELLCLAVTRPARKVVFGGIHDRWNWEGKVDEAQPPQPIAQWVVRYKRGVPWHPKRAAWWINYDLLCETGRVLPAFVFTLRSLSTTYQSRNRRMGARPQGDAYFDRDPEALDELGRHLSLDGPFPPIGLRATLWKR